MSAHIWEPTASYGGWTRPALIEFLDRLIALRLTAGSVLLTAVEKGGFIGRNPVLELAGAARSRRMPGWIKPMNRVVASMKHEGLLAWDAIDPIEPLSDDPAGRSLVYGYRVPPPLVALLMSEEELPTR